MFAFFPKFYDIFKLHQLIWSADGKFHENFDINGFPRFLYNLDIHIFNKTTNGLIFHKFLKDVPFENFSTFFRTSFPNHLNLLDNILILYVTDFTKYIRGQPFLELLFEASFNNSSNFIKIPLSFNVKKSLQTQHRRIKIDIMKINQLSLSFNNVKQLTMN